MDCLAITINREQIMKLLKDNSVIPDDIFVLYKEAGSLVFANRDYVEDIFIQKANAFRIVIDEINLHLSIHEYSGIGNHQLGPFS